MDDNGGFGIVAAKDRVELLFADIFGKLLPEGIFAKFAQRLSPFFESFPEGALAGTVPQEFVLIFKFEVETVDLDPREARAASTAAAICPRRLPARPASRLRRISCFSISVALAQNMAGRARKTPPMTAP
ncbi:hypothetical protein ACVWZM_005609 [Bradyrhizobium sp. USDA 4501]